jgi:hypothetical protein
MNSLLKLCAAGALYLAAATSFGSHHTFQIEQLYSNADGTIQFVVLRESDGVDGESFWGGRTLTSTHAGVSIVYTFPNDLPGGGGEYCTGYYCYPILSPTANKRVLVASRGFQALGLVAPDYVMPDGFLPTNGGTVSFAGVDEVEFSALPTDGMHSIDRNGALIPNLATNFDGESASVAAGSAPGALVPYVGVWWNPNESGSGYVFDVRNGVLVITIFTYEAGTGHSEWYLSSGPLTQNGTRYVGTLDKYRGGQCIACAYTAPTQTGNDGSISITFTSATSATLSLPGSRTTNIVPLLGP